MTEESNAWTEDDSGLYREIAAVAVPAREEQIAALLTLLPFSRHDSFRAVELGSGPGTLSYAILDCFPKASVLLLDGSPSMRSHARERLGSFGSRLSVQEFELQSEHWLTHIESVDCVLSSLCLHHLLPADRRRVFSAIFQKISAPGALLIADLIEPQRPEALELFASTWDRDVEQQSKQKTGSKSLYERFVAEEWNYYRFPDPSDHPSPLLDQLLWLKEAGFEAVDCFWLQGGHAIFGGYKSGATVTDRVIHSDALRSAQKAAQATL